MKNSPYTAPAATPGEWISWAGQVNAAITALEAEIAALKAELAKAKAKK